MSERSDDNNNNNNNSESNILSDDDEYDALCQREAEICQQYPDLLQQWESESGLGKQATRYGGRVGIAVRAEDKQEHDMQDIDFNKDRAIISSSTTTTTTTTATTATATTTTTTTVGRMKRLHHKPMLPLDNVHDNTQLLAWLERIRKKVPCESTTSCNQRQQLHKYITIYC